MSNKPLLIRLLMPLVRGLYPTGAVRTVLRGPVSGARFRVHQGMGAAYALGIDGFCLNWYRTHVKPGMTIYDIGANRGQTALFLSRLVGANGRVFSFEPMPEVFADLEKNLALNGIENVNASCVALSDRSGMVSFLFSDEYSTQGKIADLEKDYVVTGARHVNVQSIRLDDLALDVE